MLPASSKFVAAPLDADGGGSGGSECGSSISSSGGGERGGGGDGGDSGGDPAVSVQIFLSARRTPCGCQTPHSAFAGVFLSIAGPVPVLNLPRHV